MLKDMVYGMLSHSLSHVREARYKERPEGKKTRMLSVFQPRTTPPCSYKGRPT